MDREQEIELGKRVLSLPFFSTPTGELEKLIGSTICTYFKELGYIKPPDDAKARTAPILWNFKHTVKEEESAYEWCAQIDNLYRGEM